MTNFLEEAINCSDGDRAAKLIQDALGIESDDVANYVFQNMARRSRAARPHHRRVAADRGALVGLLKMITVTPFLELALQLVTPGVLVILLAALLWSSRSDC